MRFSLVVCIAVLAAALAGWYMCGFVEHDLKKMKVEIPHKGWTAHAFPDSSPSASRLAYDRNHDTRWQTTRAQKPGDWFALDMGNEQTIAEVVLDDHVHKDDYPRACELQLSADGVSYRTVSIHTRQNGSGVTRLEIWPPRAARFLKVVQMCRDDACYWGIGEMRVYAAPREFPQHRAHRISRIKRSMGMLCRASVAVLLCIACGAVAGRRLRRWLAAVVSSAKSLMRQVSMLYPTVIGIGILFTVLFYIATTTHWRFAYIPDQIATYNDAYTLAFEVKYTSVWPFIRDYLINPHGTFGGHRADDVMNAVFMRLFGHGAFGWKISSIFFGLAGAGMLLAVTKRLTGSMYMGCVAMLLALYSPPYFAFSHYGYHQIHAVLFFLLPVFLSLGDPEIKRPGLWFWVGAARGLCFYTFQVGVCYMLWDLVFFVSGILFCDRSAVFHVKARRGIVCGLLYLAGVGLCIAPTALQPGYFSRHLFVAGGYPRDIRALSHLYLVAMKLPFRCEYASHGSHGAYWGIAGYLVLAGWLLALLPWKKRACAIPPLISERYFLRIAAATTFLIMIPLTLSGKMTTTRAYMLIPLFAMTIALFIAPLYRRWPRSIGWLCVLLLGVEGTRCLYVQQHSMDGVLEQSRVFCVAQHTRLPILYNTDPWAWYKGLTQFAEIYGFADRYREAPTAASFKLGEIMVQDGKPTGICDCDL